MKPAIKYPVTLLILVLTGYTQVFAHLYGTVLLRPSIKQMKGLEFFQVPVQTQEKVDIYIEEEESTRISLKEYSKNSISSGFFSAHLSGCFLQLLKNHSPFGKYYSRFSFFGTADSVFQVLRL